MLHYIARDEGKNLLHFSTDEPICATPCQIIRANLLTSAVLNYNYEEPFWLYEVTFSDGASVWLRAFDFQDAVVSAVLYRTGAHPDCDGKSATRPVTAGDIPTAVREYDLYDLERDGHVPPVSSTVSGAGVDVLMHLRYDNRDLVAHALGYVNGDDPADLMAQEQDRITRSLRVDGIDRRGANATDLTAHEIRRVCAHVWHSYIFFEASDASLDVYALHGAHDKTTDPLEALFWSYIFEQWGCYDCVMPYGIYRAVTEGILDPYLPDLAKDRSALE